MAIHLKRLRAFEMDCHGATLLEMTWLGAILQGA